jgi:hypothetical protein
MVAVVVLKTVCVKVGGTTDGGMAGMAGRVSRVGAGREIFGTGIWSAFFQTPSE